MRIRSLVRLSFAIACVLPPLAFAASKPAQLEVALSVAGARVELDGVVVAESAGQSLQLEVKPGPHVVKASKDGFVTTEQRVEATAGQRMRVELLLPIAPPPAVAEVSRRAPIRIAIYELTTQGDVPERTTAIVSDAVLAEIRKLDRSSAVGMKEIAQMLSFEEQRQLLGCDDSSSCLSEIGGALGVDQLVTGSIGRLGETTTFSLRRIDLTSARVLGSVTKRFPSGTGEELLAAIGPAIEELFPEVPLRPGRTRGASIEAARRLNPPPLPAWAFWSTAGASLAAGAVAAVFGASAIAAEREYAGAVDRARAEPVAGTELRGIEARALGNAQAANIALAVAGGLAVAAGIEALFTDWHGDRAELETAGRIEVAPSSNGVVASVRF